MPDSVLQPLTASQKKSSAACSESAEAVSDARSSDDATQIAADRRPVPIVADRAPTVAPPQEASAPELRPIIARWFISQTSSLASNASIPRSWGLDASRGRRTGSCVRLHSVRPAIRFHITGISLHPTTDSAPRPHAGLPDRSPDTVDNRRVYPSPSRPPSTHSPTLSVLRPPRRRSATRGSP